MVTPLFFLISVHVVHSTEDSLFGHTKERNDSNQNVDWQIWPTSVNIDPSSDSISQYQQINVPHQLLPADVGDISSFLRQGKHYYQPSEDKLSREEVILDLLQPAEAHGRKVHVEDFLWTGSGNVF